MVLVPAFMVGGSVGLLAWWVFSLRLPDAHDVGGKRQSLPTSQKILLAYARWLGRGLIGALGKAGARLEASADRLALLADRPAHITGAEVVGACLLAPLAAAAFLILYCGAVAPKITAAALAFGVPLAAALPLLWLRDARGARLRRIRNAFPNALDLLTLTVEAGLDFTEGMKLIANRGSADRRRPDYPLSKLFAELLSDIQMGTPRQQALRRLEEKTGLPEIGSFATVLALSDEAGGSIVANLRQLAAEMRNTRLMRAEEFIAKAPVKLVFPIALFLFPVVFLVIFGPIGLQLFENLRF